MHLVDRAPEYFHLFLITCTSMWNKRCVSFLDCDISFVFILFCEYAFHHFFCSICLPLQLSRPHCLYWISATTLWTCFPCSSEKQVLILPRSAFHNLSICWYSKASLHLISSVPLSWFVSQPSPQILINEHPYFISKSIIGNYCSPHYGCMCMSLP